MMNSSPRFFPQKIESPVYQSLKDLFLELLTETEKRCLKLYRNKYDQERYAMITEHPEIEEVKSKIENCKKIILGEMKSIEAMDKENTYFYTYAFGLSELKFNVLFMKIFVGKLNKHWIPVALENGVKCNPYHYPQVG